MAPLVTWESFHTEADWDFVSVMDGATADMPTIGRYHGRTLPEPLQGSSSDLFIQLQSDGTVAGDGFAGAWTCEPAGTLHTCELLILVPSLNRPAQLFFFVRR